MVCAVDLIGCAVSAELASEALFCATKTHRRFRFDALFSFRWFALFSRLVFRFGYSVVSVSSFASGVSQISHTASQA
jgi:hypothetical protein